MGLVSLDLTRPGWFGLLADSLMDIQLDLDGSLDFAHILMEEDALSPKEPLLPTVAN
jgi:hypothetical protein